MRFPGRRIPPPWPDPSTSAHLLPTSFEPTLRAGPPIIPREGREQLPQHVVRIEMLARGAAVRRAWPAGRWRRRRSSTSITRTSAMAVSVAMMNARDERAGRRRSGRPGGTATSDGAASSGVVARRDNQRLQLVAAGRGWQRGVHDMTPDVELGVAFLPQNAMARGFRPAPLPEALETPGTAR